MDLKKEYTKQIRRIKNFIRRAEKRGYYFDENIIPKKPRKITEGSVRKLKRLTPESLYKKSKYAGEYTKGEIVSGEKGHKLELSERSKKGHRTRKQKERDKRDKRDNFNEDSTFFSRVIISNWYGMLDTLSGGEAYNLLRVWMGSIIRENGIEDTALMLEEATKKGILLTWEVAYKISNAIIYIDNMLDFIPDQGIFYKDQVLEKIDYLKRLGEALEEEEDWGYPL